MPALSTINRNIATQLSVQLETKVNSVIDGSKLIDKKDLEWKTSGIQQFTEGDVHPDAKKADNGLALLFHIKVNDVAFTCWVNVFYRHGERRCINEMQKRVRESYYAFYLSAKKHLKNILADYGEDDNAPDDAYIQLEEEVNGTRSNPETSKIFRQLKARETDNEFIFRILQTIDAFKYNPDNILTVGRVLADAFGGKPGHYKGIVALMDNKLKWLERIAKGRTAIPVLTQAGKDELTRLKKEFGN